MFPLSHAEQECKRVTNMVSWALVDLIQCSFGFVFPLKIIFFTYLVQMYKKWKGADVYCGKCQRTNLDTSPLFLHGLDNLTFQGKIIRTFGEW